MLLMMIMGSQATKPQGSDVYSNYGWIPIIYPLFERISKQEQGLGRT